MGHIVCPIQNSELKRNSMSDLYNHIFSILENANQKIEDSDEDIYCEDCSYESDEHEHYDECECSCHDGLGYFEYCSNKITSYINKNYTPKAN